MKTNFNRFLNEAKDTMPLTIEQVKLALAAITNHMTGLHINQLSPEKQDAWRHDAALA